MGETLVLPVIVDLQRGQDNELTGGTASVRETLVEHLRTGVRELTIEPGTLEHVVGAASNLLDHVVSAAKLHPNLRPESLSFQLAVSATGKIGFLGTGVDVHTEATFEITFKVS